MKCYKCSSPICVVCRDYEWFDKFSGRVLVPALEYTLCDKCGEVFFNPAASRRISEACDKKLQDWLENRPIKDFWDSQQVTEFLKITRQALSKGFQYRNLVYKLMRNGKYAYLAESVRQFKRTGDGRIPLEWQAETDMPIPSVATVWDTPTAARYLLYTTQQEARASVIKEVREMETTYA